jgi:hypothetical protein
MKKINHILLQIGILTALLSATFSQATAALPSATKSTVTDPTDTCTIVVYDTIVVSPLEMPFHYADTTFDIGTADSSTFVFHDVAANGCDSITNLLFLYRANYKRACYQYYWWVSGETYTESGMYFHYYQNTQGEVGIDTLFLTIYSPSVSIDPMLPVTVCQGANIDIAASVTGNGTLSYEWYGPYYNFYAVDPYFSIVNASPIDSGTYTLTVTATDGPCTATETATVDVSVIPAPIVEITGENEICRGNKDTLSVSGPYTYHWSNGSSATNIIVSPSMSTTYSVTATGPNGCMGYDEFPVTVHQKPVVTISGCNIICKGEECIFQALGANTYVWSTGSSESYVILNPNNNMTCSVTGTDAHGCTADTSINIIVRPKPEVSISGVDTICAGENVTLRATASGCSFAWSNSHSGPTNTVSPSSTTTYIVTATNTYECTSTETKTVTVLPKPVVRVSDVYICPGNTATLTATGADAYLWSNDMTNSTITVTALQTTTFYVVGTDTNGCISLPAAADVIVMPKPDVFIMGNAELCRGDSVTLTAAGADSYIWMDGSTNKTITAKPTESSSYLVTGIGLNSCRDTATVTITVLGPQVEIVGTDTICEGETFLLFALGARYYVWNDGSDEAFLTDTLSTTTLFSVTGTDDNGCSQADTIEVFVGQGSNDTVSVTACESYFWPLSGDTLTVSGLYTASYLNSTGCLSTHWLDLTINHGDSIKTFKSACEEFTWTATGATYTESGTYTHNYITPNGCQNVDVLLLTINHGEHKDTTVTECEHYIWPVNGYGYSVSDDYVFEYNDTNGCPSSRTLHLTINRGTHEEIPATGINSYTWDANGVTYTESGVYVYNYTDENGCECSKTLILTIKHDEHDCIYVFMQKPETCPNGRDGEARVYLPASIKDKCVVYWTMPDGTLRDGEELTELSKGQYSVTVMAAGCEGVILYQGTIVISKEGECDVTVALNGPRVVDGGCNGIPSCTFTATASGGKPPYTFQGWQQSGYNEAKKVYSPGDGAFAIYCKVVDAAGNVGEQYLNGYAKNMECAQDPNEIKGPIGFDDSLRYVNATDKMNYTIDFENDPEFAMAPATRVRITYDVPATQRISSFRLSDFGFGDFVFTVPSNTSSYSKRLDVSDSLGVWVDVNAGIDVVNHQLFWIFQSIDPATGAEPASSQMGFLPINDSLEHGEGYVSFYILPDAGVQTGDTVAAEALIVFDDNAPIGTNVWRNTFDAVAPTSTLHAELNAQDSLYCTFSFTAQDDAGGSGVNNVEVFVSVNNSAYTSIGSCAPDSTLTYALENGLLYQFVSIATDNVGNTEPFKATPDTTVNYNTAPIDIVLDGSYFYEETPLNTYIGTFLTLDADMNQHFTYELVNGEGSMDNNLFLIAGNELRTNALFECSHRTDYSIRVKSTDLGGLSIEKVFSLTEVLVHGMLATNTRATICQGESFNFNGMTLTTSGIYSDTLQSVDGCDSIVNLFLTVNPVYHTIVTEEICEGGSFNFLGQTLTGSGVYTDTLQTVDGCDSIFTLTLIVHPTDTTSLTISACNQYVWNNVTYTQSGDYTQILSNQYGCDSVVTLHLTLTTSYATESSVTACDSYVWYNQTYTESGDYTQTYTTATGCDSTVTLHLTIHQSSHNAVTETACGSFTWHGQTYTESGTYIRHYTNANGCASADTLHLTVYSGTFNAESVTTCDSYVWNGQTYSTSGTYTYAYTNNAGCASVDTLHLTLLEGVHNVETQTVCDSILWNGTTYNVSGVYTYEYSTTSGCLGIDTLNLTVLYGRHNTDYVNACENYSWYDQTYAATGIYTYEYLNDDGCPSVDTLDLTIYSSTNSVETQTACMSFEWHGTTYTASGTYTYAYTNAGGCTVEDTLHLTIVQSMNSATTETACESFTWHGQSYTTSGDYTYAYTNASGCDIVDTLHLTVHYGTHNVATETAHGSYTWHYQTYTESGTYVYTYTNDDGCASADTLHLTIQNGTHNVETASACDNFTWHGQTYTASGTYTYAYTDGEGYASMDTLHLTIFNSSHNVETMTTCDSYTWHGSTYTISGTYKYYYTNENGCPSSDTLFLTVQSNITSDFSVTTTDSCYEWNNVNYCESGDYTQTLQTTAGCDSVVTLHLTITVGIDDHDLSGIEVFPNPTNHILNIKGEEMRRIDIYNADGQLVYTKENDGADLVQVDVTRFAAGQYFVKVLLGDGRTATRKVVVNRR